MRNQVAYWLFWFACAGILIATDVHEISVSDKLRVKDAQLAVERAINALLQSPQYIEMQAAQRNAATIISELEAKAKCKLDPRTVECLPPEPEKSK